MKNKIEKELHKILDIIFTNRNSFVYKDLDGDNGVFETLKLDLLENSEISDLIFDEEYEIKNDELYNEFHNQTIKSLGKYLVKNYNKLGYINQ